MTIWAIIAVYGWVAVVVPVMFVLLPRRWAAFLGLILGWLFLPFIAVKFLGPLELTKTWACSLSVLVCTLVFEPWRWQRLRMNPLDIPILLWMSAPMISSIMNGLGAYDGFVATINQGIDWGFPYLVGRLWIDSRESVRTLAFSGVVAGLIYLPLVLIELKMSPILNERLYGFVTYSHGGTATRRFGGWRPVVFTRHGLMLGLLMGGFAVTAGWLWWSGAWRTLGRRAGRVGANWREWSGIARQQKAQTAHAAGVAVPTWPIVAVLVGVAVACRALNAMVLMTAVVGVLVLLRNPIRPTKLGLVLLALAPVFYIASRLAPQVIGLPIDRWAVDAAKLIDAGRASSLEFRFTNEDLLAAKALEQPVFGWGGWGRSRVTDDWGNDISVTDGYWIIALGERGLFGLSAWYLSMMTAVLTMLLRYPVRVLGSAEAGPAVALAMVQCMFMIDCLPNSMVGPLYPMIAGGLSSLLILLRVAPSPRALPVPARA